VDQSIERHLGKIGGASERHVDAKNDGGEQSHEEGFYFHTLIPIYALYVVISLCSLRNWGVHPIRWHFDTDVRRQF
jgi:hypothetical protein